MSERDRWAGSAASLPTDERSQREAPFWRRLAGDLGWRLVVDAGCGAGFHVRLLRGLGVRVIGCDLSLSALLAGERRGVAVSDLLATALRPGHADAVLCLGNTISLLASRDAQRRALAALATLLRPGGWLLLQGEDAAAVVAAGPLLRTRALADGAVHVRAFERRGARVRMLAGAAAPGAEAPLHGVWLVPTNAASLTRLARPLDLSPVPLPVAPPGAAVTWWVLLARGTVGLPRLG
jgi:SAM-dependent methyltransferase